MCPPVERWDAFTRLSTLAPVARALFCDEIMIEIEAGAVLC
jgi:hypothetical protein